MKKLVANQFNCRLLAVIAPVSAEVSTEVVEDLAIFLPSDLRQSCMRDREAQGENSTTERLPCGLELRKIISY